MKFPLTIIFLLITPLLFAQQNLVPNPGFEDYSNCPDGYGQISYAIGWYPCSLNSTPDYYNKCNTGNLSIPQNFRGYQECNNINCNGYSGEYIYIAGVYNKREFMQTNFSIPLSIGLRYYCSMKISLADISEYATNNIGFLFTTYILDLTYSPSFLNFAHVYDSSICTDKTNWKTVFGSFIADSSYNYITIGNFFDDLHTDTLSVPGDSNITAYYYIDDVCVSTDSSYCYNYSFSCEGVGITDLFKNNIEVYPNPARDELTIDYETRNKCDFELYDVIGAKRMSVTLDWGSKTKRIDLTGIDNGLYFYSLSDTKGNRIKTGKLTVIK